MTGYTPNAFSFRAAPQSRPRKAPGQKDAHLGYVRARKSWRASKFVAKSLMLFYIVCAGAGACRGQEQDVVCSDGNGGFQTRFERSGVIVRVGAARAGGFATRKCEAALGWNKQSLTVATNAAQIDIDTVGVDLGLGVPVATFQVKKLDSDCCMEYQVYSLRTPPKLLRSISGGDYFSAADSDLDGRVEIWTHDTAAADGFDGLNAAEFDSAPTIILRFERGKLLDVSSEFQPFYDREIAKLQGELSAEDLRDFKNSDGKLAPNGQVSVEREKHLRDRKVKILEIVWCYLYSGREQQAWNSLAEMWPISDAARIRRAILDMRAHGIGAQLDGTSAGRFGKQKRASIFDATSDLAESIPEVRRPEPILLMVPPVEAVQQYLLRSEVILNLVVDSAGKVRSAEPAGKPTEIDQALIFASTGWKFIPAFKNGRPVACRIHFTVSAQR